ncbi:unnamed protein product [Adineta steineri]|uniref:Uncharacterized protein n=1 Tax=Adineta steineri TaxID=433720 RepID=A0A814VUM1_9BILA|nr:unnamed protein product [Adineta steineri]
MNQENTNNNSMCNQNQILKNLPLKKRRTYLIDSLVANDEQNENFSKTIKQSYSKDDDSFHKHTPSSPNTLTPPSTPHMDLLHDDSFHKHTPSSPNTLTPPSTPHMDLLRQQYAYLSTNPQQNYLHSFTYDCLMAQQLLDNYRILTEQQKYGYTPSEDETINEHFRKSLGDNYGKFTDRCFTPDDSSSNSSSIEQTSVDSIEEHFARSLAKFGSMNPDEISSINRQITESIVDDHFAKALGSKTWEKLKDKS